MTNFEDDDYAYALSLQNEFDNLTAIASPSRNNYSQSSATSLKGKCKSLVDPEWELIDPNPDVHTLFIEYNKQFFWGRLDMVSVRWSPRMTLCAGVCCNEGGGGLCSIRLSKPLLSLRPRKDLVETLLHEMIHAYLFVTNNNRDRDGHGPEFCKHMNRINQEASTNISVNANLAITLSVPSTSIYHSFHDEVAEMRKHWWRCEGVCRSQQPFFGYVKRSMNRAPSKNDTWWSSHQQTCGGAFVKIKEPEDYGKKKKEKDKGEKSVLTTSQKLNSNQIPKKEKTIESFLKNYSKNTAMPSTSDKLTKPLVKENADVGSSGVTGGNRAEVDQNRNPRGIPLNSRLLAKFSSNENERPSLKTTESSIKSRCQDLLVRKAVKSKVKPADIRTTPLQRVCRKAERTGVMSVNSNARAFKEFKVVTGFLTANEVRNRVNFSSDDEENVNKKKKICNLKNRNDFKNVASGRGDKFIGSQGGQTKLTPLALRNGSSAQFSSEERITKSISSKRKSEPDAASISEVIPKKKRSNFESEIFVIDSSSDEEVDLKPMSVVPSSFSAQHESSDSDDEYLVSSLIDRVKFKKQSPGVSRNPKSVKNSTDPSSSSSILGAQGEPPKFSSSANPVSYVDLPRSLEFNCPICDKSVPAVSINQHVDHCLTQKVLENNIEL